MSHDEIVSDFRKCSLILCSESVAVMSAFKKTEGEISEIAVLPRVTKLGRDIPVY
jgi:hypothetical protein